jgi:hypothetical protein
MDMVDQMLYQLTTYEYDTYGYSGISEGETFLHLTKEGALAHAAELKLTVVEYCKDPEKEATLAVMKVLA